MDQQKTKNATMSFGKLQSENIMSATVSSFMVKNQRGMYEPIDFNRIRNTVQWACTGYETVVSQDLIIEEALRTIYDKITTHEIEDALVLGAVAFIEREPAYGYIAARFLCRKLFREVTGFSLLESNVNVTYRDSFMQSVQKGIATGIFDTRLGDFDLAYLAEQLQPERDNLFDYMGLKTLYERYFAKYEKQKLEMPQAFWMRVAMGLAYNEPNKNERAVEFYNLVSTMLYIPGTPTLLHSGMHRPQLSSCFLTTVTDDLAHIFKCLGDNAQLSKWSGGVANDWTNIRATGSMIQSIKTESQGVIPFLKIANDVTAAINRSGSRRGATCVYLETWHMDIEDFIDLRRNTGDERRRTHDINTANWIPDLFMKRVLRDEMWTLFSPEETPDLHSLYGKAFEKRYAEYEQAARNGAIKMHKTIEAKALWKKMLTRLFETGHPWLTFKDACNIRSPQDHAGVVHSSNLCTEITLNTSADETAVCNLGSVNLAHHIKNGMLDIPLLRNTVTTAVRMLDNVIDINFYPTAEAERSNLRHRPIGLGLMGFQDALYKQDIAFEDEAALTFADTMMETVSFYAISASSSLAKERGAYASYKGSKWDRNIFPVDTIDLLEKERGMPITCSRTEHLDWAPVREHVKQYGMRNSNVMAIAPTATISNIAGCFPCIEPIYKNIYVKSNMSGEFTVVNKYLIEDLKKLGLWSQDTLDQLKYYDGNLQLMQVPAPLKAKYKEAFEISPMWLVKLTTARGKWIDQSQSHNVFIKGTSGKLLSEVYIEGWQQGIKTYYYLRSLGASQVEKSTLDAKKFGFTQKREYVEQGMASSVAAEPQPVACSLETDPSCESCQ